MYLGKGTMLTANFLRSAFSCPGNLKSNIEKKFLSNEVNNVQWIMAFNNTAFSRNLRLVVTPDMVSETRWFKSP